jgi:hypothetical protein
LVAHGAEPTRSLGGYQYDGHLSGPAPLPLRWPPSGRKTENPAREFSQRGCYQLPGEQHARDSKYALYLSSLLAGQGDPGRFFEEIRKQQANRLHGILVSWLHVEYYRVPPVCVRRFTLACLRVGTSGRPHGGLMSRCRRCWCTVEALCCKATPALVYLPHGVGDCRLLVVIIGCAPSRVAVADPR